MIKVFTKVRFDKIKTWRRILLAALVISLIPLMIISFYNHSSADDYSYGIITRNAWVSTHSVISLFKAVALQVKTTYTTWQGTYAAVIIFALQPAVFGEQFYFLTTWILVGALIICTFYFFRTVLGSTFGRKDIADIVSVIALLISIQTLPHAIQSFFWWNGSSYYTLFYSFMILQAGITYSLLMDDESGQKHKVKWAVCFFLGFVISGGNFISALVNLEIAAFLVLCSFVLKKHRAGFITLFGITIAGFIISLVAPGNAIRMATETQINPVSAIMQSFSYGLEYVHEWMSVYLVIALVFLIPFLWRMCGGKQSLIKHYRFGLIMAFLIMFAVFSSSFTPTVYTSEQEGPRRVQNIRYFMFIVMSILLETGVIYEIRNVLSKVNTSELEEAFRHVLIPFFACLGICLMIPLLNDMLPKDNRNNLTSISAARSLLIGEAKEFDRTADERMQILLSDEKDVVLPAQSAEPKTLFYADFDITGDVTDWRNVAMADFFDKDSVRMDKLIRKN